MRSDAVASQAAKSALSKKALDVIVMDLRPLSSIADFFVIASGHTDTHVRAIADGIAEGLRKRKVRPWHVEGYGNGRWVLLDFVEVVVHVFDQDTRNYYALDRIWGDAPSREFKDEPPKRLKESES